MKHSRFAAFLICLFLQVSVSTFSAAPLYAHAEDGQMPRLIQTVTEQDIYEGLVALGFLETPVLEEADCERAYENVKACVVRIQMGNAHGSGIVWELTPEMVVIATNRHVLEYWKDTDSYVYFSQGYYVDARVLGVSARCDVGFLAVDNEQFSYEELREIRSACIDEKVYRELKPGDQMFSVEIGSAVEESHFYEATVMDTRKYIGDFDAYMLYGHGFAKTGMSGGGTFDGRGYLIGMTTGGTLENETAGVPLPDIVEAYGEIVKDSGI